MHSSTARGAISVLSFATNGVRLSSTARASPRLLSESNFARRSSPCPTCSERNSHRSFSTSTPRHASAKDPYSVLGVKRDSKPADIKRAYYDLAKKFHPDTNKESSAKERFVEIQNAYDLLSDQKKRAAYDQYGTTDDQPGFDPFGGGGSSPFGAGGFGGFQDFGSFGNAGNAGTIFENLFGAFGGGRPGSRGAGFGGSGFAGEARGEDLETAINISFEEACKGAKRKIIINPIERCSPCAGSGLKPGAKRSTCKTCNGTGTRTFVIQSGFQMATTCPSCGGSGTIVAPNDNCKSCDGVGRVRGRKEVEIDLPAGVDDGFRIRKDGFGDVPLSGSGSAGSLYVRINVAPSKIWRRQGSTLFYTAQIPFHTAILGGKVRVQTLEGPVEVLIPSGTQVGEEMILQGRGVPSPTRRNQKGDLIVQFQVNMPRSLTKRQREILQQYAEEVEGQIRRPTSSSSSASASESKSKPSSSSSSENQGSREKPSEKPSSSTKPAAGSDAQQQNRPTGGFTIHASSRTDHQGTTATKDTPCNPNPSQVDANGEQRKSDESQSKKDGSSEKGILNKALGWITGK